MNTVKCKKCGEVDNLHYSKEVEEDLMRRELCFTCGFWDDIAQTKDYADSVRIDGTQYHIGREEYKYSNEFRGFGGRIFHIKFNDGREITTTNLWCNGTIPENFKDILQDNAIFMVSQPKPKEE